MTETVISVKDLTKFYPTEVSLMHLFKRSPRIRALNSVNFNVYRNEIFGILGPNGAGKTTLIKILASLILPDSGSINILNHDLKEHSLKIKNSIGIISGDERGFYWRLTGRENLRFFGILSNLENKTLNTRVPELLEYVGLKDSSEIMFKEYSSGMKTRLQLARALLTNPAILLLDEPTKSLDIEGREKFRRLVKEPILGRKTTVILATHSLEEAEAVCDRYIILKKGELVIEGDIHDIRNHLKLDNHINLSISSEHNQTLVELISEINSIDSVVSIHENITGNILNLSINYTEEPLTFLTRLLTTCNNKDCKLVSLNVNSKDLKEVLHYILDIKEKK